MCATLILTLAATFVLPVLTATLADAAELKAMDVFLLMGQSNMSGRAPLEGAPDFPGAELVFMWRPGGFTLAHEPVATEPDAAFGPSLAFGSAYAAATHRAVGLINCAVGGTKIAQWAPSDDAATLYGTCLKEAREAAATGKLRGILWYQGEFDTFNEADADAWAGRFRQLLAGLRRDFGMVPMVVTQIGPRPPADHPWLPATTVIEAQGALTEAGLAVVSATDLPFQNDELHLTQPGQIELGHRYAATMLGLIGP
jgi:hypothetical protein